MASKKKPKLLDKTPNKTRAKPEYITNGELTYIPVPKCMSSTMQGILLARGWEFSKQPKGEIFGIIREPIGRWVSGMAQTFYRLEASKDLIKDIDPYVNQTWYDPHTAPQVWSYEHNVEIAWDIQLFRLDQLDALEAWFLDKGMTVEIPEWKPGTSEPVKTKEALRKKIEEALTDEHKEKLATFYAADVELFEENDRR